MSSDHLNGLIWMDGWLVPVQSANVHVLSHTLMSGSVSTRRLPRDTSPYIADLAIRKVRAHVGLVRGLDRVMDL